jgi:CSLREA domain-containing protein
MKPLVIEYQCIYFQVIPPFACSPDSFFSLFTLLALPAQAATITVNSTADALTTNGQCALREALINANNDAAAWPDCTAGSGTDTIDLPAGTITFAIPNTSPADIFEDQNLRGDLDITSSLTIMFA